jgi:carboxymethylenebutenolidase
VGEGPFPAAILFPHVGGLTETMRDSARRAAEGGFLCVIPDLYHRLGTIVLDPQSDDSDAVAIRKVVAGSLTLKGVAEDTRAALDWLDASADAAPGPRGTIGYGRSGSFALLAAASFPERIRAAATVLGFGFKELAEAGVDLAAIKEVYVAFAENDDIIPAHVPGELKSLLEKAGTPFELVVHLGARHPYAFADRAVYDESAAESDWSRIFALFARHLSS